MTKDKQQLLEISKSLRGLAAYLNRMGQRTDAELVIEAAEAIQSLLVENERLRAEAWNLLRRIDHRVKAHDWVLSGDDSKAIFHLRTLLGDS